MDYRNVALHPNWPDIKLPPLMTAQLRHFDPDTAKNSYTLLQGVSPASNSEMFGRGEVSRSKYSLLTKIRHYWACVVIGS